VPNPRETYIEFAEALVATYVINNREQTGTYRRNNAASETREDLFAHRCLLLVVMGRLLPLGNNHFATLAAAASGTRRIPRVS